MEFLDKKADKKFLDLLRSVDELTEAIAMATGVPEEQVREELDKMNASIVTMMHNLDRQEIEFNILKMLKPDATIKDYVLIRTLTSILLMKQYMEMQEEQGLAEKLGNIMLPEKDDEALMMLMGKDGELIAIKGGADFMATIMSSALALRSLFGTFSNLPGVGGFAINVGGPGEEEGGDEGADREGDTED